MTASALTRHTYEFVRVDDAYSYLIDLAGKPLGTLHLPNLAVVVYGEAGGDRKFFFVFAQGRLVEKGMV